MFFVMGYNRKARFASGHDDGCEHTEKCKCFNNVSAYCRHATDKYYRYVDKAGSYAARNFAVNKAKGRILVFTDSDTKPVSNWIQGIKSSISEGCVIAGKISLEIVEHNIWEYYDFMAHLNSEKEFLNSNVATANMAVLKEDFVKVGFFEAHNTLDNAGNSYYINCVM